MTATDTIGPVDPDRLYSGTEAARLLCVNPRTIMRWRVRGQLVGRYPGGRPGLPRYLGADIIAARERRA